MAEHRSRARVVDQSALQRQAVDWLELAAGQHAFHALIELDVTEARQSIRVYRRRTGRPLSLTGYVVGCFARAVAEDSRIQAMRKGRGRLVLFDDVDVAVPIEYVRAGQPAPVPIIVRAANRKSFSQITRELGTGQVEVPYAALRRWLGLWLWVPPIARRWVLRRWLGDPYRRKRATGTVMVTALGMFGHAAAWAIPPSTNYPIALAVGGLDRRPGPSNGSPNPAPARDVLAVTLVFDHDIVDGAPAARFTLRLRELIEGGVPDGATAPAHDGNVRPGRCHPR